MKSRRNQKLYGRSATRQWRKVPNAGFLHSFSCPRVLQIREVLTSEAVPLALHPQSEFRFVLICSNEAFHQVKNSNQIIPSIARLFENGLKQQRLRCCDRGRTAGNDSSAKSMQQRTSAKKCRAGSAGDGFLISPSARASSVC